MTNASSRLWIRAPLGIFAEGAGNGLVVADGLIVELVPTGHEPEHDLRRRLRREPPRRHPRPGQRPSSFLSDADTRASKGAGQGIVRLADGPLSDLGPAHVRHVSHRGAPRLGRVAALRLYDRRGSPLSVPRRARPRHRHRGRGSARARNPHDGDTGVDEPLAEGRRPAAR